MKIFWLKYIFLNKILLSFNLFVFHLEIEAPLTEPAAPEFTELLQPYTVHDGDRAEFRVRFTGQPLPKITWFYDGKVITSTNDIQITVDYERKESILIIVEVFPEDEGEYTCSASNEYGETITTCKLTVTCKFIFYKVFL